LEAFRQGLRDLGYVEGQNIVIESRYGEGKFKRLSELAAELVRRNVDVLVALGNPATRAAKEATRTIPIVIETGDPVGEGFVTSLAHPGGNITGMSDLVSELDGKRLEFLKGTMPHLTRIAVCMHPAIPRHRRGVHDLTVAAQSLGVELHIVELRSPDEFERAFAAIKRADAGAFLLLPGVVSEVHSRDFTALALQHRLPGMYPRRMYVDAGGLMSYGTRRPDVQRRLASYVDKLLKGAKPADLPIEQPMQVEMVINLKTANALGLAIPPTVLFQADEVLQ
jgi:putative ABC transport system substrate-binding protein